LLEDDADPNPQFLGAPRDAAVALYRPAEYGDGAARGCGEGAAVLSMAIKPASARMSVDLPEPDAPISATISRRPTEKLTSSSTRVPRSNDFETRRTSMTASFGTPISCNFTPFPAIRAYQPHMTAG
jgi:hypothetical protein